MKTITYSLKHTVVLFLSLFITSHIAIAQCTPQSGVPAGIYPDTTQGIFMAQSGVPYNQTFTLVIPTDTTTFVPQLNTNVTLGINYYWIDSIQVLLAGGGSLPLSSTGLYFSCMPTSCQFPGGSTGCFQISGTPNQSFASGDRLRISMGSNVNHPVLGDFDAPLSDVTYHFNIPSNIDVITGKVFNDANNNCQQDIGENSLSGRIVRATPGNHFAWTDNSGNYTLLVGAAGNYTISHTPQTYWNTNCPTPNGTHNLTVTTGSGTIQDIDFGTSVIGNINDLEVVLTNLNFARPGFNHSYKVDIRNVGTTTLSGNLELQHDALLHYNYSNPAHTSYGSSLISWDYGPLQPGEYAEYRAYFTVDTQAVLGDYTNTSATVYPVTGDTMPVNNIDDHRQIIQGSYDPNDKAVVPADGITPEQVVAGQPLTYTIRFQNTGTDTAFTVVVRDTLSPNLEIETFEVLSTSHNCVTDLTGLGYLAFTFNNILLADSNVNEPASHGFIKYRIKPKSNLVLGDEIHNTAAIYFDFNAPVITNTTVTEVKILDGITESGINLPVNIYPNPTSDFINIEITDGDRVGAIEMQLTNVSGQIIRQMSLNQVKNSISIDGLASGFYFISLIENGETRDTRKVIITQP